MKIFEHWSGNAYKITKYESLRVNFVVTDLDDFDAIRDEHFPNLELQTGIASSCRYYYVEFENDTDAVYFKMLWLT